jgi:glutathione S-transferase
VIHLYQFPPIWNIPNASMYCMKTECYLKLSRIKYKIITVRDPRKAPRGKLPFIKDTDNNKIISDSSFIIEYLKTKFGDKLDQNLSSEQQAVGLSIQRLLEDHFNWLIIYERWVDDNNWKIIKREFFGALPVLLQLFVPGLVRRNIIKLCHNQGISRYTNQEREVMGKKDIHAIVTFLGNKPFILKDSPSSIDCIVWTYITQILYTPISSKLKDYANTLPTLLNYDKRMKQLFEQD